MDAVGFYDKYGYTRYADIQVYAIPLSIPKMNVFVIQLNIQTDYNAYRNVAAKTRPLYTRWPPAGTARTGTRQLAPHDGELWFPGNGQADV